MELNNKPVLSYKCDTYYNWIRANPILNKGNIAVAYSVPIDIIRNILNDNGITVTNDIILNHTNLIKFGDGVHHYDELEFDLTSIKLLQNK